MEQTRIDNLLIELKGLHNALKNGGDGLTYDIAGLALDSAVAIEALQAYKKALETEIAQYQTPMLVIQENWNPSVCPRCKKRYYDYEDCEDGYYDRATGLERCPYCGQKLKWD